MKRLRAVLLGVCAVVASVSPVRGSEVVLVTSLPKELFEGEKKAFEATPGVKVVVKQRTNQGVTYLRETRAKPDADLCLIRPETIRLGDVARVNCFDAIVQSAVYLGGWAPATP